MFKKYYVTRAASFGHSFPSVNTGVRWLLVWSQNAHACACVLKLPKPLIYYACVRFERVSQRCKTFYRKKRHERTCYVSVSSFAYWFHLFVNRWKYLVVFCASRVKKRRAQQSEDMIGVTAPPLPPHVPSNTPLRLCRILRWCVTLWLHTSLYFQSFVSHCLNCLSVWGVNLQTPGVTISRSCG